MRPTLLALGPLVVLSSISASQEPHPVALDANEAARLFAAFEEACTRDGGALWGVDLMGPVLIVDPVTRGLLANAADPEGLLTPEGDVFRGTLPRDQPIASAPIEWAGRRWAMVVGLLLPEALDARVETLAHESFHRVQPELGLYPFGAENVHLDTVEGRVGLQLEWRALLAALRSEGDTRRAALRDALDFRAARRARFPEAGSRENALELREGLATYTGARVAGLGSARVADDAEARIAREDGFGRGFAYVSGPLQGWLLDALAPGWRSTLTRDSDLGALLAAALDEVPDPARAVEREDAYDGPALRAAEEARARVQAERVAAFHARLVDGPVLVLDLSEVRSGTMNTRKVFPLDETRIVFTERTLQAAWGALTVGEGGAWLEDRGARRGHLPLEGAAEDGLSGPGWTLELAEGWHVVEGERAGDRRVARVL